MKRVTAILRASEVTEVRKAIFTRLGDRIVAITLSHRLGAAELADWCRADERGRSPFVRLSVTVDDTRTEQVVSTIIASALTGMIEKITAIPVKIRVAHPELLTECAA